MKKRELLKKGFVTLFVRSFGAALGFLLVFFLAKFLGVGHFGVYFLVFTIVSILSVFTRWGLDRVLLKRVATLFEKNQALAIAYVYKSIAFVSFFSLLAMVVLWLLAPLFNSFFLESQEFLGALRLFVWVVLPMSLLFIISESFKSVGSPVLSMFLQSVVIPGCAILFAFVFSWTVGVGLSVAVIAYLMAVVVGLIVSLVYLFRFYPISKRSGSIFFKELFHEGRPMLLVSAGALVMSWTDILVLGIFESEEEVGLYALATRLALVTSLVLVVMNSLTAPKYALLYSEGDIKSLEGLAKFSSMLLLFIALVPVLIFVFFAEEIMGLFGTGYVFGAEVLVVLSIGALINVSCGSVGYLLTMTGRERVLQNIMITTALLNILLSVVFVTYFGMLGVAYATAISVVVWNVWSMYEVKKHLGFWTLSPSYLIAALEKIFYRL